MWPNFLVAIPSVNSTVPVGNHRSVRTENEQPNSLSILDSPTRCSFPISQLLRAFEELQETTRLVAARGETDGMPHKLDYPEFPPGVFDEESLGCRLDSESTDA